MRKRILVLVLAALASGALFAEPYYVALSVTQTVQSQPLPAYTQTVTIVSDDDSGATCHFRLFTNVDTPGDATVSNAPVDPGMTIEIPFLSPKSPTTEHPSGVRDSESYSPTGARARYYRSISAICAAGQTASWRVYAK